MKTTGKLVLVGFFLICLLLLFSFTKPVIACPCPDCPPCYESTGPPDCECVCNEECCENSDCGDPYCYNCNDNCGCECWYEVISVTPNKDCACVNCDVTFSVELDPPDWWWYCECVEWSGGCTPATQDGGCWFTTRWDTPGTKTVTACVCDGASCDSNQVTICDPVTQVCCDGSCCDKVWTKETHTAINESCPSVADCKEEGCDGVEVTVRPSYDSCLNVGVGTGEHCECNETLQVVGYDYTCEENWDWSRMTWCLAQGVWCVAECFLFMDPAGCANCLAGIEDCCDSSPCSFCDFLESCDPSYPEEIKKNKFTDFGC